MTAPRRTGPRTAVATAPRRPDSTVQADAFAPGQEPPASWTACPGDVATGSRSTPVLHSLEANRPGTLLGTGRVAVAPLWRQTTTSTKGAHWVADRLGTQGGWVRAHRPICMRDAQGFGRDRRGPTGPVSG